MYYDHCATNWIWVCVFKSFLTLIHLPFHLYTTRFKSQYFVSELWLNNYQSFDIKSRFDIFCENVAVDESMIYSCLNRYTQFHYQQEFYTMKLFFIIKADLIFILFTLIQIKPTFVYFSKINTLFSRITQL